MFDRSIAYRLSVIVSLAVIVIFLVFIIVSFFFNRQIFRENIENKVSRISLEIDAQISINTLVARKVAENVADQIIYYAQNGDAENLLSLSVDGYPFINAIHIHLDPVVSLSNNYFTLHRDDKGLIFRESDQKINSFENDRQLPDSLFAVRQSGWTEPYRCKKDSNIIISYYCPVKIRGENNTEKTAGIVVCELSLTGLNRTLGRFKIGKSGYAFIINRDGKYIAHPTKADFIGENVFTLSPRIIDQQKVNISSILEQDEAGSTLVYPKTLDYKKSRAYYSPTNENKWFLVVIMPNEELFRGLYLFTFRLLFFALLGIVAIYFLVSYISNKLISPLSAVTKQLTKLSRQGRADEIKTLDEIKQVSDSLNYLRSWFENYEARQSKEEKASYRRRQDLIQASEIQQSLIKTNFPAFPDRKDIDLYALFKPAGVVSGDLFDYFFIDDENLVFTVGDVSGKGIPAAIFMSIAQTVIKNHALDKEAKRIVKKANQDLCTSNLHQFFLTLFLGVLNTKTGKMNYCNAAHTPALILKPDGKIKELKETHGLPLGLYTNKQYNESNVMLEKGDKIILYTDGITELQNPEKRHYGIKRFKEFLSGLPDEDPGTIVQEIEKSLEIYSGHSMQNDDICLLIVEYK